MENISRGFEFFFKVSHVLKLKRQESIARSDNNFDTPIFVWLNLHLKIMNYCELELLVKNASKNLPRQSALPHLLTSQDYWLNESPNA